MTAAKPQVLGAGASPLNSTDERLAIAVREFRQDLAWWIGTHPRTALRVMRLVEEIVHDPFISTGKPEALKHRMKGEWSRRITNADRLVYLVRGAAIYFLGARSHYGKH
jgi:toxin YoeB